MRVLIRSNKHKAWEDETMETGHSTVPIDRACYQWLLHGVDHMIMFFMSKGVDSKTENLLQALQTDLTTQALYKLSGGTDPSTTPVNLISDTLSITYVKLRGTQAPFTLNV